MRSIVLSLVCMLLLVRAALAQTQPANTTVHFTIDAARDARPISRYIYGINQSIEGAWSGATMTRCGGNRWTAFNWVNNASNAGSDWQFQNDNLLGGGNVPGGALVKSLANASDHHAGILLTIPMAGYVSADITPGGDVRHSGANYLQTRFRPELPAKNAPFTLTPDPAAPAVYQDEFVNWIKTKYPYGTSDAQRPIWFLLDNEPDLWSETHAEVHPKPVTYEELTRLSRQYAAAIKAVEPDALVFGPVSYGWNGFVSLQNAPDANGRDFLEFYLTQMAAAEKQSGKRLLDVLDVHWYPEAQGGGKRIIESGTDPALVAARLAAPRSLWDPNYVEKSWITDSSTKGPIRLLPRLMDKIARCYPGTKLSISEYNYGGGNDISGAIAEADVLGIFGRDGVFCANEWPMSGGEPFIAGALNMYRNYDGKSAAFGDTTVYAQTSDVEGTSIYAAVDSTDKERLVLIAINKRDKSVHVDLAIDHFGTAGPAAVFRLAGNSPKPAPADAINIPSIGNASFDLPARSVSTIVMRAGPS